MHLVMLENHVMLGVEPGSTTSKISTLTYILSICLVPQHPLDSSMAQICGMRHAEKKFPKMLKLKMQFYLCPFPICFFIAVK